MRCLFSEEQYAQECGLVRGHLEKQPGAHWREFLSLWKT